MKKALAIPVPTTSSAAALLRAAPVALDCLNSQLLGRRRLLCSRVDACREIPHVFAVGPVLLVAWLATLVGFVLAVR